MLERTHPKMSKKNYSLASPFLSEKKIMNTINNSYEENGFCSAHLFQYLLKIIKVLYANLFEKTDVNTKNRRIYLEYTFTSYFN